MSQRQTQYARILDYLRKHRVATVRDLMRFTNYPSARLHEMTLPNGAVSFKAGGLDWNGTKHAERITRTWVERNGQKVRLYCLVKA